MNTETTKWEAFEDYCYIREVGSTRESICEMSTEYSTEEMIRQSKLIAAAPQMFDALRDCTELMKDLPTLNGRPGLEILVKALKVLDLATN